MTDSPGASVVTGQDTGPTFGSLTATLDKLTVPVLVTTKLYAMVSPGSSRPLPLASTGSAPVLSTANIGTVGTGVLALSVAGAVSVTPGGEVPVAVAVLSTVPASASA